MYSFLADLVVVLHAIFVGVVVFGLLAIWIGALCRWRWVRNFWARLVHLGMIGFVAVEAAFGVTCPLTTLERYLRRLAGESVAQGSFMGRLAHHILFYDAPQWIFNAAHIVFGIVVLLTFLLIPPRWPRRRGADGKGQDESASIREPAAERTSVNS